MKKMLMSVFDSQMRSFVNPFFIPTVPAAVRSFTDEVNRADANNMMYQHPEDFSLWKLGELDDETGEFVVEKAEVLKAGDCLIIKE